MDDISCCPICTERFTSNQGRVPKVLPCGHTLCGVCIETWRRARNPFNPLSHPNEMVCPLDRMVFRGVFHCPQNFLAMKLIEEVDEKKKVLENLQTKLSKMQVSTNNNSNNNNNSNSNSNKRNVFSQDSLFQSPDRRLFLDVDSPEEGGGRGEEEEEREDPLFYHPSRIDGSYKIINSNDDNNGLFDFDWIGSRFVALEGGRFMMGSPPTEELRDRDETLHSVYVSPFEIANAPVTRAEWEYVMNEPARKSNDISDTETCPVTNVSWEDIMGCDGFIARLNRLEKNSDYFYDLPTEAEWEYAARAGTSTPWSFGSNVDELGLHCWYSANANDGPRPIRRNCPNPWGLYDMHGNVFEWCKDRYGPYLVPPTTATAPTAPATTRGGRGGGGGGSGVGHTQPSFHTTFVFSRNRMMFPTTSWRPIQNNGGFFWDFSPARAGGAAAAAAAAVSNPPRNLHPQHLHPPLQQQRFPPLNRLVSSRAESVSSFGLGGARFLGDGDDDDETSSHNRNAGNTPFRFDEQENLSPHFLNVRQRQASPAAAENPTRRQLFSDGATPPRRTSTAAATTPPLNNNRNNITPQLHLLHPNNVVPNNLSSSEIVNPQGSSTGIERVVRGGCWGVTPRGCRSAFRNSWAPDVRCGFIGFRLVRVRKTQEVVL